MNGKELERINLEIMCNKDVGKHKETLSPCDIKSKENNSSTSENK